MPSVTLWVTFDDWLPGPDSVGGRFAMVVVAVVVVVVVGAVVLASFHVDDTDEGDDIDEGDNNAESAT